MQIGTAVNGFNRADFRFEFARGNRSQGTAVAFYGKRILVFARYFPLVGHVFSGQTHAVSNGKVFIAFKNRRIQGHFIAHHRNHRHRLHARGDGDVGLTCAHAVGRDLQGIDAR